jgi:hypothetical protein
MATATKDVVVCVDPYTTTVEGVEEVFQQGTRLRADHPTVIAHPELWAKDGDLDEFNAKRRALYAEVGRNRIPDTGAARILNTRLRAKRAVKWRSMVRRDTSARVTYSRPTMLLLSSPPVPSSWSRSDDGDRPQRPRRHSRAGPGTPRLHRGRHPRTDQVEARIGAAGDRDG